MRGNAGDRPQRGRSGQGSAGPGLAEVLVVWGFYGLVALDIVATYSRISPDELYHVSETGLAGGLGRALVFVNWPGALTAIAVLALVNDRAGAKWPALAALGLCLVILVPGVVEESDLDAKWVNVLPALGVAIALALTLRAVRVAGIGGGGSRRGDRARIVVAVALGFLALPWIFAEAGVYIGDVPVLGSIFRSKEVFEGHAAVHLGEHHGFVGYLLIVTALLLTRELPRMRAPRMRAALALYLSGLIAYGLGNMANDAWLEQVVKRGWTSWETPGVIRPDLTWMWGLTLLLGLAIYAGFFRARSSTG
jgi:hypothetical protein